MKKKTKVLMILLVLGILSIAYCIYVCTEDLRPKYCELTDKEREFMNAFRYYNERDMKRFEEGMLYEYEIMQLNWLRRLYADLEERYPGYRFYISGKTVPGLLGRLGYSEYYTEEEITGRTFKTYVYLRDGDYGYEEDTFYAYFIEEEYAEYIGELLKKKGVDGIAMTEALMDRSMGKECDSTITVEDIVSGHIDIKKMSPHVSIYLMAKGMTEEECKRAAEDVQEILEEINFDGSYNICFCDMAEEEITSSEKEDRVYTYVHRCQSWNWGKEEE